MDEDEDAFYGALAAGIAFAVIIAMVVALGFILGMWA